MSDENINDVVQEDDTPALNPIFRYKIIYDDIQQPGDREYLQVSKGYFNNDRTINPIFTYYYDWGTHAMKEYGYYTAKDFDMVYENDEDPRWVWSTYRQYTFYQGRWYINYVPPNERQYIADESDGDIIDEGISLFSVYYYNEEFTDDSNYYLVYCSSANEITVNGQKVTAQYEDWISTYQAGDMVWLPPGLWFDDNDSGYGYICTQVPDEIKYKFIGTTTTSLQDGDTNPNVLINGRTVTAQEYNIVYRNSNAYPFIYYDGQWNNIKERLHKIGQVWQNTPDDIPEFTSIALVNDPEQPDFKDYERIKGLNINVLTINGVETQVQLFDYVEVRRHYYSSDYYRLVYGPGGIWVGDVDLLWPSFETSARKYIDVPVKNGTVIFEKYVELKWTDPSDISDWEPTPATWLGTVIIRKEGSAPKHRWDGVEIIDSTTRDEYKEEPYKDDTIAIGKTYYYGFFPYYTARQEDGNDINFFRFTKVIKVETGVNTYAPVIESITVDGTNATITYSLIVPKDTIYTSIKLYGKIDGNPACDNTDDIIMDLDENKTSVVVRDLEEDSTYYFCIECIDNNEAEVQSNIEEAEISGEHGIDKWKNVKYNGETVSGWKPVKFNNTYLKNTADTWMINSFNDSFYPDESKISSDGVSINVQQYIDIAKAEPDVTHTDVIYRSSVFELSIVYSYMNWGAHKFLLEININGAGAENLCIFRPISEIDGHNITLRIGIIENDNAATCGLGGVYAGVISKQSDKNYWFNSSGDGSNYNLIHGID